MPRRPGFSTSCTVLLDGVAHAARDGEPLVAALLADGVTTLGRSPKYHRARGAFCLSGACAGCLLRVDGIPSRKACRTTCHAGLSCETQNSFPGARHDLLGLIDLATPRGLDHHRLGTSSVLAAQVAVALSRRLAGVGRAPDPDATAPGPSAPAEEQVDALVVGAGAAGLAAAEALAAAGRTVLVADTAPAPGGGLRARLGDRNDLDLAWATAAAVRIAGLGGEVATSAEVAGLWHDGGSALALLHSEVPTEQVRLIRPRVVLLCTGAHPIPPAIPGGDRPGVLAARGLAVLLADHGVVPGARVAVVGADGESERFAAALAAAGVETERVESTEGCHIVGRGRVRALARPDRRIPCDIVAVAGSGTRAPALELARALGAPVRWDGSLAALTLAVGPRGETGVPGLLAAGEVAGTASAADAAEAGRAAGKAALG